MDIWLDVPTPVAAVLPRRVWLPSDRVLTVGRDVASDIFVPDRHVRRKQGEVGRDGCGAWIRDFWGGEFRILVNAELIEAGQRRRLLPNDVIMWGDIRSRVGWNFEMDPYWLRWEAGVIAALAGRIRDEGDSAAMPILADALEEVGCNEAGILEHLRGPGPHVRECWVIDALLRGK